jgi:hypothetical protein
MKVKTIIISSNGSTSFYNKNLSFNITNQYLFFKKTDKNFFFIENKRLKSKIYENIYKHQKKYF